MNRNKFLTICLLILSTGSLSAWRDHTLGTYPALANMAEIKDAKPVPVESFESFLIKENKGLAELIKDQEDFARKNFPNYLPKPDKIIFNEKEKDNIRKKFLLAMRLNPEIKLSYYIQELPGIDTPKEKKMPIGEITILKGIDEIADLNFVRIYERSLVSPLAVIATAADEPDYGHDIGLYTDSNTEFGKILGFDEQPFGDKRFEYSSQAPFHMGFYHEEPIIYSAAEFLKRTNPEYRIYQNFGLARFAFKTGHPYWGYRFMGWGLHYIQDLTQPYHSRLLPGKGETRIIFTNIIALMGMEGAKNDAIKNVADRHTAIENYQFEWFESIFKNKEKDNAMLKAFSNIENDKKYGDYTFNYPRNVLSKEAHSFSDELDKRLEAEWNEFMQFTKLETRYSSIKDKSSSKKVDEYLIFLMNSFGSHTRNYVRAILK